ncbi:unnamed protein product [Prorocentrum cordatum]|uniref:Uncharacterized protein n=1 Tax=Prorocentrum cordatum TaxID=2364126 RepID=A0ABN9VLI9_9DINO|nr:unnamed protein product [Polarella glacialis]
MGEEGYRLRFGATPFARRGGLPGTTARLAAWCRALASAFSAELLPQAAATAALRALVPPLGLCGPRPPRAAVAPGGRGAAPEPRPGARAAPGASAGSTVHADSRLEPLADFVEGACKDTEAAEGLLQRVSNTWLRYVYPAALLGVGILRRETIAGALYVGAALVFASSACGQRAGECRRWRVVNNVFTVTFSVFLLAACLLVFLCSFEVFEPWPAYLRVVGFGGVTDGTDCGSHWLMLPEALATTASVASWLLLRRAHSWEQDDEAVVQVRPLLTKQSSGILVGILLVLCASMSLNLFGLLYNMIAAAVLACLASAAPRQGLSPNASRRLRCALGATTAAHVLTAIFLGFGGDSFKEWRPWPELLGAPDDAGSAAQCVGAFALLQVLLWCADPPAPREREEVQLPASPPTVVAPAGPPLGQGGVTAAGTPLLPQDAPGSGAVSCEDAVGPRSGSSDSQQSIPGSARGPLRLLAAQLLSAGSMLAWALVWPSMLTVLLLAGGLAVMTVPAQRISRGALQFTLLYQYLPRERLGLLSFAVAGGLLSSALAQASREENIGINKGLGYLAWFLCLVARACAAPHASGWDALDGSPFWWRCLVCYSSLTAVLLFCWQVLAEEDVPLAGLVRARSSFSARLLPHVAASLLASVQVHAQRAGLQRPGAVLAASAPVPMQLLSDFGVFAQMLLVIMIVRAPPVSIWSFLLLLLFVALVTVEQSETWRSNVRERILLATAMYCIVQLPVRYLGLLPGATKWLASVLPGAAYNVLDSLMALEGHDKESREEMAMVAALLVLSSYLLCGLRFYGAGVLEVGSGDYLERTYPVLARVLVEAARWSTLVCMVVAFWLLFAHRDLLSRIAW